MQVGSLIIDLRADIARLQSDMDKANRTVGGAMQKIERQAKLAMNAIGGIVGAIGIRELSQAADTYTKLTAQLKLATRSAEEYAQAYSNVQRIARSAQADLSATAQVYARLSNALRDTGASQQQVADISETISLALRVNGATAAETASAMLQLSQAFGSGRLAGEEFRAVAEAAPGLLRELARSIGVPVGALKEMAKEGKLTTDVLANAWTNPTYLAGLREQVKEVATISSAIVVLKNNFITLIGEMDKANGASKSIANGILFLADQMAFLADMAYGTIEVFKQFGRSLAVVFNDIKTFGQVAGMSANVFTAILNKDKIAEVLRQREEFTKAANEDLEKFLNSNFRRFRDAMRESREEAAKPYDDKPLKAYGKAVDEAATKAEKLRDAQALKDLQAEIDFEEEMRETRAKLEREGLEKQKKIQLDWYDDMNKRIVNDIEQRAKAEQDNFKRTNEAIVREIDDRGRAYQEMARDIERSLTDALLRGFESGKDFAQNFKETLINMFKTMVLRPVIKMLVDKSGIAGIGSLFSGNAMAGDGSSGGMTSTFSSMFDAVSGKSGNLSDMFVSGVAGKIGSLGSMLGSTGLSTFANGLAVSSGTVSSAGASLAAQGLGTSGWLQAGKFAGAYAPYIGAAIQALSGDVKGAAFTAAGAAIGSIIPGIGTAIGAMIGSVVGGLVGGKDIPMVGSGGAAVYSMGKLTGSSSKYGKKDLGAGASVQALSESFSGALGGLLSVFDLNDKVSSFSVMRKRTNVRGFFDALFPGGSVSHAQKFGKKADIGKSFEQMVSTVLGPLLVEAIQKSQLSAGIKSLFDGISDKTQVQNMIGAAVSLKNAQTELAEKYNLTVDAAARVSRATGAVGDQLVAFVGKLTGAAMAGKKPSEMLIEAREAIRTGINNSFGTVVQDAVWETVTRQVEVKPQNNLLFGGSRSRAMGGIGSMGTQGGYWALGHFFEAQKQFKTVTEQVLTYVDRVIPKTVALPQTLEEYDKLLKSINTSTQAGVQMFAEVFSMRDQFIAYTQAIDGLKAGVKSAIFPMLSASEQQAQMQADLAKLFGELNQEIPGSIQELVELGRSIDYTTESGLDLAAAFPSLVQAFIQTRGAVDSLINSLGALDPNRFKTLVDLNRAQSYVRNGISLDSLPSYDVGTPFVPKDGPAMIHRGERILTAEENRQFTKSGMEVAGLLRQLIDESRRMMAALIIPTQKTARVLERFDNEGIPLSEIDREGNRVTIDTKVVNSGAAEAVPVDTTP